MTGSAIQMLMMLGVVAVTIAIVFISKKLRESGIVDTADLQFAVITLKLTMEIVDELNLNHEKDIKNISTIVIDALEFAVARMTGDYDDLLRTAEQYAFTTCEKTGIKLTPERIAIITELLEIALKNNVL